MFIDVNVSLGHWPFQRFLQDSAAKLSKHLASEGISLALVSSIESVFYPDPDVYNKLLLKKLKPYSGLMPVMVVNPARSDWKERLEEYTGFQKVGAVKIFPNYHNYSLSAGFVKNLMNELDKKKIVLMIQMRVEDERNQYPLLKTAGVNYKKIIKIANCFPRIPVLCLCPYCNEAISLVEETKNVYVDISFAERLNTVDVLLKEIPADRLLFGSHTPFLYTRSAVMKVRNAEVSKENLKLITFTNACRIFKLTPKIMAKI